ncbi:ATP-binding cassette domain-containing protein [Bifidobacterium callimiconis]|uniref:ABC transporter ATP-binding protein n=1 Tax=Bifidobacterium callimiconis TaxID=2306973 RepID=UPI001BDD62F1|nr:ATP-binding cassette domain-containing protein [Bifidobacterium callimiconis]MBT1176083.1 ATP-binding cassette domain-containing protein [Bifidobacterium callimiconis]
MLEVTDARCRVRHGDVQKDIFAGLSLTLYAGQIVDLVGPSGSGKSTLMECMAQLNADADATMTLDGRSSDGFTPEQWRTQVAYVPQRPVLMGGTVAEAIRYPFTLRVRRDSSVRVPDDDTLRRALDDIGLDDVELDRSPQDLSVGQQARVCLLRTLLTGPKVLLADEVDAGLDPDNAMRAAHLLRRAADEGMAVCRVRHREPDGMATRTLELADGVLTDVTGRTTAGVARTVVAENDADTTDTEAQA